MNLIQNLKASFLVTLVLGVVCCGFYPLLVWGLGQGLFPAQANGSLLRDREGHALGSSLIGQAFTGAGYFHPRPSAAGTGYDATSSGGSNLGPTSKALADTLAQRVADYRKENGLPAAAAVPADAVTASASGLDPHIGLRNALLQVPRIAAQRGLKEAAVRALVAKYTEGPFLGLIGGEEPGVNVLRLNLALDGRTE